MRILAIGAHCDDVEIGAGGMLQRGTAKRIVVLSRGEKSGDPSVRAEEAHRAAAILGAEIVVHSLHDTALEMASVLRVLEAEIRAFRPDRVLTEPREDSHQDHRAVYDATLVAVRDLDGMLLTYFSPSAAERWQPNWFIALNDDAMVTKVRAAQCHASQAGKLYLEPDYLRANGRYWAQVTRSQAPFVEAYRLIRYREAR